MCLAVLDYGFAVWCLVQQTRKEDLNIVPALYMRLAFVSSAMILKSDTRLRGLVYLKLSALLRDTGVMRNVPLTYQRPALYALNKSHHDSCRARP